MGYILPEIYKSVCNDISQSLPEIFIETGTAKGGTPHTIMDSRFYYLYESRFRKMY